jgi:hypothetical protein
LKLFTSQTNPLAIREITIQMYNGNFAGTEELEFQSFSTSDENNIFCESRDLIKGSSKYKEFTLNTIPIDTNNLSLVTLLFSIKDIRTKVDNYPFDFNIIRIVYETDLSIVNPQNTLLYHHWYSLGDIVGEESPYWTETTAFPDVFGLGSSTQVDNNTVEVSVVAIKADTSRPIRQLQMVFWYNETDDELKWNYHNSFDNTPNMNLNYRTDIPSTFTNGILFTYYLTGNTRAYDLGNLVFTIKDVFTSVVSPHFQLHFLDVVYEDDSNTIISLNQPIVPNWVATTVTPGYPSWTIYMPTGTQAEYIPVALDKPDSSLVSTGTWYGVDWVWNTGDNKIETENIFKKHILGHHFIDDNGNRITLTEYADFPNGVHKTSTRVVFGRSHVAGISPEWQSPKAYQLYTYVKSTDLQFSHPDGRKWKMDGDNLRLNRGVDI